MNNKNELIQALFLIENISSSLSKSKIIFEKEYNNAKYFPADQVRLYEWLKKGFSTDLNNRDEVVHVLIDIHIIYGNFYSYFKQINKLITMLLKNKTLSKKIKK